MLKYFLPLLATWHMTRKISTDVSAYAVKYPLFLTPIWPIVRKWFWNGMWEDIWRMCISGNRFSGGSCVPQSGKSPCRNWLLRCNKPRLLWHPNFFLPGFLCLEYPPCLRFFSIFCIPTAATGCSIFIPCNLPPWCGVMYSRRNGNNGPSIVWPGKIKVVCGMKTWVLKVAILWLDRWVVRGVSSLIFWWTEMPMTYLWTFAIQAANLCCMLYNAGPLMFLQSIPNTAPSMIQMIHPFALLAATVRWGK